MAGASSAPVFWGETPAGSRCTAWIQPLLRQLRPLGFSQPRGVWKTWGWGGGHLAAVGGADMMGGGGDSHDNS